MNNHSIVFDKECETLFIFFFCKILFTEKQD